MCHAHNGQLVWSIILPELVSADSRFSSGLAIVTDGENTIFLGCFGIIRFDVVGEGNSPMKETICAFSPK